MTVAEQMVRDLIKKKQQMQDLYEEMIDIESNFGGMEVTVGDEHGMIDIVDSNTQTANIYLEDMEGNGRDIKVTFDELLKILGE